MKKQSHQLTESLRQISQIRVIEWDLMALLNTDIKDLELSGSLRRLGNRRVMEWDFRQCFSGTLEKSASLDVPINDLSLEITQEMEKISAFVRYVAEQLIDEPEELMVDWLSLGNGVVRLSVKVAPVDMSQLIGVHGYTSEALRRIVRASGVALGIHVLLEVEPRQAADEGD